MVHINPKPLIPKPYKPQALNIEAQTSGTGSGGLGFQEQASRATKGLTKEPKKVLEFRV